MKKFVSATKEYFQM